jgi:hypothetical protein
MPRIVHGCVESNAVIYSGEGFSVINHSHGLYEIIFDQPFTTVPAVVATQQYSYRDGHYLWDDFDYSGGSTKDNVVIIAITQHRVKLKTGDGYGNGTSRNFTFIAIGT